MPGWSSGRRCALVLWFGGVSLAWGQEPVKSGAVVSGLSEDEQAQKVDEALAQAEAASEAGAEALARCEQVLALTK